MALEDDLKSRVAEIFRTQWTTRDGRIVPEPKDLALGNDAVHFDRATILYADLSGSTKLVDSKSWQSASEIYKTFLHCSASIIRGEEGIITSYDGDRIMGVFIGKMQSSSATRCALKINYAVKKIVQPAFKIQYSSDYQIRHVVGIDTSEVRVARTGVRGDNDMVWVGRAANYAAKLTELSSDQATWITKSVFDYMEDKSKYGGTDRALMWKEWTWNTMEGMKIYSSNWTWKL